MRYGNRNMNAAMILAVVSTVLLVQLFPEFAEASRYYILAAAMILIGIPHGAIDHIVSSKIYDLKFNIRDQLKFYIPYLLLMLLMAVIWFINGLAGFLLFALITIYHFGQADIDHIPIPENLKTAMMISRGIMILALIIFFDTAYTIPIISSATGVHQVTIGWLEQYALPAGSILFLQHPLLMVVCALQFGPTSKHSLWLAVVDSALIFILFAFSDPIIGFSIYFALWHSMGHVQEMKDFFTNMDENLSYWKFYKLAAPFTIISGIGLWAIYQINQALGIEDQMVALLFILISVLTLPHVFVVQKMYDWKTSP